MRVSFDGKEADSIASVGSGTVGQAYDASVGEVNRMGRTVLEVRLDGKLVASDERSTVFDRSVDEFEEMLLETVKTHDLVRAALTESRRHLTLCRDALRSSHTLLAASQQVKALKTLKPTLDVWMAVCEAVAKISILMGTNLTDPIVEDISVEGAQREVVEVLGRTREIFENKDWVGLSDLIEYEFLPLVTRWEKVCQALETQTTSGTN